MVIVVLFEGNPHQLEPSEHGRPQQPNTWDVTKKIYIYITTKVEFTHLMIRLKAVAFKIPTLANLLQDDR